MEAKETTMAEETIPTGLTEEDMSRVGRLESEGLSANTIKMYERQWRKVRRWMRENDYPDEPPMDPEHVRDCLTYFFRGEEAVEEHNPGNGQCDQVIPRERGS